MANINGFLNKIRTAIFGKDVRGSIVDGIEAINKETESTTKLSNETKKNQDRLEKRWDTVLAGTTNGAEVIDMRVDKDGVVYDSAGKRVTAIEIHTEERLDADYKRWKTEFTERGINVKWFGATGDGITDDTQSIKAAILFAYQNKINLVYFPYGRYKVTENILVLEQVVLVGHNGLRINASPGNSVTFLCYAGKKSAISQFKLQNNSGMKGFSYIYPEQVNPSDPEPIPYGYTIDLDAKKEINVNIDNVILEDLFFLNSYDAINLYRGGRFYLNNIHGQPLHKGIYMDHIKDIPRAYNVHFWTYYAVPTDPLFKWIKENGIAFEFGNVDGIAANSLFAYGYNKGYSFIKTDQGKCWGTFTACVGDACVKTIYSEAVNLVEFVGGAFTTADIKRPIFITGDNIEGNIKFIGSNFFGGSSIGAVITSNTGSVQFEGVKWDSSTLNNIIFIKILINGKCRVIVNGDDSSSKFASDGSYGIKIPVGDGDITLDGVRYPKFNKSILLPNFNMAAWSNGKPDNWKLVNFEDDMFSKSGDGIKIKLRPKSDGSNNVFWMDYALPTSVRHNPGLYMLKFKLDSSALEFPGLTRFKIKQVRDDGSKVYTTYESNYATPYFEKPFELSLILPIPRQEDLAVIRIECSAFTKLAGEIEISNLSLKKANPEDLSNQQIEFFSQRILLNPKSTNQFYSVKGFNSLHYADFPPNAGEFRQGDEIRNISPSSGGNIGWICVSGGTPGTWTPFGKIE